MPQRNSVAYGVYADGVLKSDYRPVHIVESAGAQRLDTAVLEYRGASLDYFYPADLLNQEIEIVRLSNGQVVHWGKVTQLPTLLNGRDGETVQLVSRAELFHLGDPVDGFLVWDPLTAAATDIDGDLVFNPMIDGVIYGNKNDTHVTGAGCLLFLDPESVRTPAAQTLQGANVARWTLAEAVYYLLWALNTPQTHIANPDATTLAAVFSDPTVLVQEVRIPRGTFLAQALDLLLEPLGYRWRIKRTGIGERAYEFWKRGTGGSLWSVYHQPLNSTLSSPRNLAETNVHTSAITFDIANIANAVRVRGGFEEIEMTVELARGWESSADPTSIANSEDYAKDAPGFDGVRDVLRKWVLNEAGDYIGTRTELDGIFPTAATRSALNSIGLLTHFLPRRRKLLPTLTQKANTSTSAHELSPVGELRGVEVEYSNTSPASWKPIKGWDCAVLEQEGGIYFDGDKLPVEFFEDIPHLKVRATFTLQSDYRLTGYVNRWADSPNEDTVQLVLDLPDRFRYRQRPTALSKYGGGGTPSLVVDDSTAIAAFATYVRNAFDLMGVSGPVQLEGLDNDVYSVGDRIEKMAGKEISFLMRTSSGQYPQVIAIERDIDSQTLTLHIERQRDVIQLPPAPQGNTPRFRPRHSSRDYV